MFGSAAASSHIASNHEQEELIQPAAAHPPDTPLNFESIRPDYSLTTKSKQRYSCSENTAGTAVFCIGRRSPLSTCEPPGISNQPRPEGAPSTNVISYASYLVPGRK